MSVQKNTRVAGAAERFEVEGGKTKYLYTYVKPNGKTFTATVVYKKTEDCSNCKSKLNKDKAIAFIKEHQKEYEAVDQPDRIKTIINDISDRLGINCSYTFCRNVWNKL